MNTFELRPKKDDESYSDRIKSLHSESNFKYIFYFVVHASISNNTQKFHNAMANQNIPGDTFNLGVISNQNYSSTTLCIFTNGGVGFRNAVNYLKRKKQEQQDLGVCFFSEVYGTHGLLADNVFYEKYTDEQNNTSANDFATQLDQKFGEDKDLANFLDDRVSKAKHRRIFNSVMIVAKSLFVAGLIIGGGIGVAVLAGASIASIFCFPFAIALITGVIMGALLYSFLEINDKNRARENEMGVRQQVKDQKPVIMNNGKAPGVAPVAAASIVTAAPAASAPVVKAAPEVGTAPNSAGMWKVNSAPVDTATENLRKLYELQRGFSAVPGAPETQPAAASMVPTGRP